MHSAFKESIGVRSTKARTQRHTVFTIDTIGVHWDCLRLEHEEVVTVTHEAVSKEK